MVIRARVSSVVILIVSIIVLLSVFAGLFPEVESSGNELESKGVPLGTLFRGTGAVVLLIAVGWFLSILDVALGKR